MRAWLAVALGGELLSLHMLGEDERSAAAWQRRHPEAVADPSAAPLPEVRRQLLEYLAGERRAFDLPLAPRGTGFQRRVWRALTEIPYGETRSYLQIAHTIGHPDACRAVGAANGDNPIAVIIPCHRVIGSNGALTGYGGGLPMKRFLLELEDALPRKERAARGRKGGAHQMGLPL